MSCPCGLHPYSLPPSLSASSNALHLSHTPPKLTYNEKLCITHLPVRSGTTPLHFAALWDGHDDVQFLLSVLSSSNPSATSLRAAVLHPTQDATPLHFACSSGAVRSLAVLAASVCPTQVTGLGECVSSLWTALCWVFFALCSPGRNLTSALLSSPLPHPFSQEVH